MNSPLILVDRQHPAITILTLNRPDKCNAINIPMLKELHQLFIETEQLPDQRIVILTGSGKVFCSGLDLKEAIVPELIEPSAKLLAKVFTAIYNSPLITIAAVQGTAIAGGAGIALACDLTIAVNEAQFGFPEVRRGLVAAQVSTLLCRQLSMRQVKELLLLGEMIDAEKAHKLGIINRVVASENLMPKALEIASIILKGGPKAIIETKNLLRNLELISLEDDLKIAIEAHHRARLSDEAKEYINTYFKT